MLSTQQLWRTLYQHFWYYCSGSLLFLVDMASSATQLKPCFVQWVKIPKPLWFFTEQLCTISIWWFLCFPLSCSTKTHTESGHFGFWWLLTRNLHIKLLVHVFITDIILIVTVSTVRYVFFFCVLDSFGKYLSWARRASINMYEWYDVIRSRLMLPDCQWLHSHRCSKNIPEFVYESAKTAVFKSVVDPVTSDCRVIACYMWLVQNSGASNTWFYQLYWCKLTTSHGTVIFIIHHSRGDCQWQAQLPVLNVS